MVRENPFAGKIFRRLTTKEVLGLVTGGQAPQHKVPFRWIDANHDTKKAHKVRMEITELCYGGACLEGVLKISKYLFGSLIPYVGKGKVEFVCAYYHLFLGRMGY